MTEEFCCAAFADSIGDGIEINGEDTTLCGVLINFCPFCGAPLRDCDMLPTLNVNSKYEHLEYTTQTYLVAAFETEERPVVKIKYPYQKVVQLDLDFIHSLVDDE